MNKVILIGIATRDAELRQTGSVKPVANILLATNLVVNGEETIQFHAVVCWDRLAEITAEYVKRGDLRYVEGRVEYRTFQDEEGKERGGARSSPATSSSSVPAQQACYRNAAGGEMSPNDIPF